MSSKSVSEVLARIQTVVDKKKIRLIEIFVEHDGRRSNRVTLSQFERVLDNAGVRPSMNEVDLLVGAYGAPDGSIEYRKFVEDIDKVHAKPASVSVVGIDEPMKKLLTMTKSHGIAFSDCFRDVDKLRRGAVTEGRFRGSFPFDVSKGQLRQSDLDLIVEAFRTPEGEVSYRRIHNQLLEMEKGMSSGPPVARPTAFVEKNEGGDNYEVEMKLAAYTKTCRTPLSEFFCDVDKLRKGQCSNGQARTVFDGMVSIRIAPTQWEALTARYGDTTGRQFNYRKLCECVEGINTGHPPEGKGSQGRQVAQGAQKQQTRHDEYEEEYEEQRVEREGHGGDGAQEDNQRGSEWEKEKQATDNAAEVAEIVAMVRNRLRKDRQEIQPSLQGFDKMRRGNVTKSQFGRALSLLNIRLTEKQIDLLCESYGSNDNLRYVKFCRDVEPG